MQVPTCGAARRSPPCRHLLPPHPPCRHLRLLPAGQVKKMTGIDVVAQAKASGESLELVLQASCKGAYSSASGLSWAVAKPGRAALCDVVTHCLTANAMASTRPLQLCTCTCVAAPAGRERPAQPAAPSPREAGVPAAALRLHWWEPWDNIVGCMVWRVRAWSSLGWHTASLPSMHAASMSRKTCVNMLPTPSQSRNAATAGPHPTPTRSPAQPFTACHVPTAARPTQAIGPCHPFFCRQPSEPGQRPSLREGRAGAAAGAHRGPVLQRRRAAAARAAHQRCAGHAGGEN